MLQLELLQATHRLLVPDPGYAVPTALRQCGRFVAMATVANVVRAWQVLRADEGDAEGSDANAGAAVGSVLSWLQGGVWMEWWFVGMVIVFSSGAPGHVFHCFPSHGAPV